ncbi:MAG TPA: DHH family phosphoesterase, partial [Flexilinea sp.]|nr:DHH family phosphoesterase [Flexilinea sp.]
MEPLFEWKLPSKIPLDVLEQLASFPRVQQRLLYNRGIRDSASANSYLRRQGSLYDPFLLDQMDLAVKTILQAIDSRMKIAVYGDYDVDGVTASALLIQVLTALGAEVRGYIPNRFEEGYGVNKEALHTLHEEGIALTITVDCGIRSPEEALFARSLGMELIITDHHEPGDTIPEAAAVICPKKPSDSYPDKNLAGVGLAYKLAEALLTTHPVAGIAAEDWEDFVAVGTVADMVSLTGENRSLVKSGLQKLRVSSRPCIRA